MTEALMRCANCKHFKPYPNMNLEPWKGAGHCSRWYQSYGDSPETMKPNDCWVESDEGWANQVGPEFGCVLFENKEPTA